MGRLVAATERQGCTPGLIAWASQLKERNQGEAQNLC